MMPLLKTFSPHSLLLHPPLKAQHLAPIRSAVVKFLEMLLLAPRWVLTADAPMIGIQQISDAPMIGSQQISDKPMRGNQQISDKLMRDSQQISDAPMRDSQQISDAPMRDSQLTVDWQVILASLLVYSWLASFMMSHCRRIYSQILSRRLPENHRLLHFIRGLLPAIQTWCQCQANELVHLLIRVPRGPASARRLLCP